MHTIDDEDLVIHHNGDWSGSACIVFAPHGWPSSRPLDEHPPDVYEWRVDAHELLRGRIAYSTAHHPRLISREARIEPELAIPYAVACRAVALAVLHYMHTAAISLAEKVWIPK